MVRISDCHFEDASSILAETANYKTHTAKRLLGLIVPLSLVRFQPIQPLNGSSGGRARENKMCLVYIWGYSIVG